MSDYTPDTAGAQSYYVAGRAQLRRQITGERAIDTTPYSHEFDRWLAEVERAAATRALTDFANELNDRETPESGVHINMTPYRDGLIDGINRAVRAANRRAAALGLTAGQEGESE